MKRYAVSEGGSGRAVERTTWRSGPRARVTPGVVTLLAAILFVGLFGALLSLSEPASASPASRYGVFSDAACDELAISTDADCWSGTSGGAGGAGVPSFGDDVTLDSNTGTFSRMDANLTVENVTWVSHPFDLTTGGFVFQANGTWAQDSGQINIDVGVPPGGIVVLGDFTLNGTGFILYDESDGFVDVRGDFLLDDEAYVDVSPTFTDALISVAGNYTALSVNASLWDSTDLTVVLEGTQAQTISTTTDADLDLLILRNSTKSLVSDLRGIILRADAGVISLTVENGRTITLGPSGRIENLTLRSDVRGSLYNLVRAGGNIVANNTDFQDADGSPFVRANSEIGNVDSGNNVLIEFLGIAPLTFLDVTWQQSHLDPGDPTRPSYRFFEPQFGETPVPRVQVLANNDPFEVTVTRHDTTNVTFEICTSEASNELLFVVEGLLANRQYRLLRNGAPLLLASTDGSGVWTGQTSGTSGTWDECPTDLMSLTLMPIVDIFSLGAALAIFVTAAGFFVVVTKKDRTFEDILVLLLLVMVLIVALGAWLATR